MQTQKEFELNKEIQTVLLQNDIFIFESDYGKKGVTDKKADRLKNQVTAIKDIITAITPSNGNDSPISKPITKAAPRNPNKTPSHFFNVIFSFKIGPAKAFVRTGCSVTIKAAILVGRPIEIE